MAERTMRTRHSHHQLVKANSSIQRDIINGIGFGIIASLLVSVIAYVVMLNEGKVVFKQSFTNVFHEKEVSSKVFKVNDSKSLYAFKVRAPFLSGWVYYDVQVFSSDGKTGYLKVPISLSYYSGYEGGERWHEGQQEDTKYFRLPKGEYKFSILGQGGKSQRVDKKFKTKVHISLFKDTVSGGYTFRWFLFCLFLFGGWFLWIFYVDK